MAETPVFQSISNDELKRALENGFDIAGTLVDDPITREGYSELTPEDYETDWSDYGRALGVGALGIGSGVAALSEYATDGAIGGDTRRYLDELSEGQIRAMSPAARRALGASFIADEGEESIFDAGVGRSLALKTTTAVPSLIASLIPAGVAATLLRGASVGVRAGAAGATARGTAGVLTAGEVVNQIYSKLDEYSDEELAAESDVFAGYLTMMSPEEARAKYMRDVAGVAPIAAGAISAALGGVEAQVARRLGGEAAKGVLKGGAKGAVGESVQEGAEAFTGELLSQGALAEAGLDEMSWIKLLSQTIEGGTIGGILGGGAGAISGVGGRTRVAPPVQETDAGPLDETTRFALEQEEQAQPPAAPPAAPQAAPQSAPAPTAAAPEVTPEVTEQEEAPAPQPRAFPYLYNIAERQIAKLGLNLPPEALNELASRVSQIAATIPGSDNPRRFAELRNVVSDLAQRFKPVPAPTIPTPSAPAPTADEAAMQAGLDVLGGPVPERPRTLQEQVKMLLNGQRQAVYIPFTTPEAERPKKPKGMEKVFTKNGVVYYNPARLNRSTIRKADEADRLNDILPFGATPQFEAVKAVKERGAKPRVVQVEMNGVPVADVASSTETVAQDVATVAAQAPAEANVIVRDDPENVLQERIEGRAQDLAEQKPAGAGPKTGRVLEAVTNKENQAALNKQLAANLKKATKEKKAPRTFKSGDAKTKRESDNAVAKELFAKWVPENPTFPQTDADRQALLERLDGIVNEANERGVKILDKVLGDTVSGELAYLTEARALRNELKTKKKKVSDDRILTFLSRELGVKKGEVDEVKSERRSEGEMASRQDQGEVDGDQIGAVASQTATEVEQDLLERIEDDVDADEKPQAIVAAGRSTGRLMRDTSKEADTETESEPAVRGFSEGKRPAVVAVTKSGRTKIEVGRPKVEGKITLGKKKAEPATKQDTTPRRTDVQVFRENVGSIEDLRQNPDLADVAYYAEWLGSLTDAEWKKLEGVFTAKDNPFLNTMQIDPAAARAKLEEVLGEGQARTPIQNFREGAEASLEQMRANPDLAKPVAYMEWLLSLTDAQWKKLEGVFTVDDNPRLSQVKYDITLPKLKAALGLETAPLNVRAVRGRTAAEAQLLAELESLVGQSNQEPLNVSSVEAQEEALKKGIILHNGQPLRALQNTTLSVMKRFILKPEEIQNPVLREVTSFIWDRIDARIPNMQVLVMLQSDIQKVSPEAGAFYTRIGSTDVIAVPAEELNDRNWMTAVLTHEAVHGMTSLALDNNPKFYDTIKAIADEVRSVMPAELMGQYGFTNAHEFLAEAFANARFQETLANVQISDRLAKQLGMQSWSVRSLWDGIVNAVRQLLNMPPNTFTALEGVMRMTRDVMAAQSRLPRNAELAALGMVPSLTTRDAARQAAQGFAEAVTPTSIGKRKALLATSTLDQIRQWYRGVFVNAQGQDVLEKLVSNIQRIRPFADDKRERGEKLAQRFMDFARKNPQAANEFADIANSTTMLNAQLFGENKHWGKDRRDSWQARALLPDLQRRFAALEKANPEARKLYEDMVAYYRDTQNEITRQLVDNILAEHDADLSDADRQSLTYKVMHGTLDDAARALINNDTIYNALKDARTLRVIEGDYFPLMRHGEFVVQTRDSVGDTMGGVEVEPGVIEFTANSNSDALKMAEAFAKRTTKGKGFTEQDGVPLVLSGPTTVEMPSDSNQFKYRVKVQLDGVHMFDTQAEAESFIRDQKGKFAQISEAPLLKRDDGTFGGELSNSALAAIAKSISARDGISQGQKEMMLTALKQAAVRQMAGNRVQKRSLPRRGFVGASDDLARNTLVYAEASTRYLGKLRYMPLVREAFSEMQKLTDAAKYSKDHQMMDQVLQHMRKRVDGNVITEQEASPFVRDVMTMSYIDKLFSPAYSFLQTMQPTMMTFPYLSGRYGVGASGNALSQAYRAVGAAGAMAGGLTNTKQAVLQFAKTAIDATDVLGSILKNVAKQPDAKALTDLINELAERGAIDKNAGMEIAEVVTKGRGKWAMGLSKVDRIARQLPASIEQVNRAVTAIAAYRLAVQNGTSPEKAKSMAFDAVMNTQGDYSASNAPSVFNHPIWRISLQFKKYAQMYYAMFGDMLYRAFKDASPEERRVARKQLANVVAVQILAAGTLGIPGMEVIKIGFMAAATLGFGGGYDDFEREVRAAAAAMFGATAGELITKGVIPRAIGIDLSTRLGADSLLTFGEPRKYDETNVGAYMLNTFIGAPGSLIADQFKAARAFADGEFAKGAQLLPMPKFLADTAKATQKAIEGSTSSKTGRQTEEPIGVGTALINAFGLRTADQAERTADRGAQIEQANRRREAIGEMTKLKNQFAEAKNEGERVRVLAQLKKLNANLPEDQRQTPAQFRAFAKRYQRDKAKGLIKDGARFRNEAERAASERTSSIYNYTR